MDSFNNSIPASTKPNINQTKAGKRTHFSTHFKKKHTNKHTNKRVLFQTHICFRLLTPYCYSSRKRLGLVGKLCVSTLFRKIKVIMNRPWYLNQTCSNGTWNQSISQTVLYIIALLLRCPMPVSQLVLPWFCEVTGVVPGAGEGLTNRWRLIEVRAL